MMWDYSSSGLWEAESGYNLPLEDLPLGDRSRSALRGLIRRLDNVNDTLTDDAEESRRAELIELDRVGRELWADIRRELSTEYEVGYAIQPAAADSSLQVLWSPDAKPEPLPWGDDG